MKGAMGTALALAFRRTALPLASYYAVTLALPLANGAAQSGAPFVDHALVVLAVPPAVTVFACVVNAALDYARLSLHGSRSSGPEEDQGVQE